MFDVVAIVVEILVHVVLHLYHRRWIGGDDERDVAFDAHAHDGVVARCVVLDGEDRCRRSVEFFHEFGAIALRYAAHRAEECAVGRFTLFYLANNRYDFASEHFRAIFDEVEQPYFGHFAINVVQILGRDWHPFWLAGSSAGGGVHHRFAGEENVFCAVFVLLHIRAQILVIVQFHALLIACVEFGVGLSLQNFGKMMFATILRVFGIAQNVAQRFFARFARVARCTFEFQVLNAASHAEQEIRNKRTT